MRFENIVLNRDDGVWYRGEDVIGPATQLEAILNVFGKEGFRLSAVSQYGSLLVLERMVIEPIPEAPKKPAHLGMGDEE